MGSCNARIETCLDVSHKVSESTFKKSRIDLVEASRYMIDFLQEVDQYLRWPS